MKIDFMPKLSPDEGATGGSGIDDFLPPAEEGGETPPADQGGKDGKDGQGDKDPAWFSQLPKEIRENAENKAVLGKHKNLSDLAMAYLQNEKDLGTAIRFPKKDDAAGIKKFFMQLGMPENATDYELDNYDMKEEDLADAKEIFRKAAHSASLTKGQAKAMWRHEMALSKAAQKLSENSQKKYEDSFEPSYHKLMESAYPVEAERTKAIKGEISLIQGMFSKNPAIAKAFKTSGLVYNAEVMHELAGYIKQNTAERFVDSQGGEPEQKPVGVMGNYSEQFLKAAGK